MLNLPLNHLYKAADAAAPAPWLLVLMHGVGSNEADLFGLADFVPPAFHVLSLRAPYAMAPNMFAWFQFGVNPDGSRRFAAAADPAQVQATCFDALYHELFNEQEAAPVFDALQAWLDARWPLR